MRPSRDALAPGPVAGLRENYGVLACLTQAEHAIGSPARRRVPTAGGHEFSGNPGLLDRVRRTDPLWRRTPIRGRCLPWRYHRGLNRLMGYAAMTSVATSEESRLF